MPTNLIEEELGKRILGFIEFIPRYFKTSWLLIIHPKKTFFSLSIKETSLTLTNPAAFWGVNIILSASLAGMIGYGVPKFTFQPLWLHNIYADFFFIALRYFLGYLLFLTIIKCLIVYRKPKNLIILVFPIFCYCSVLYLPYVLVHQFMAHLFADDLLNEVLNFLNILFNAINIPSEIHFGPLVKVLPKILIIFIILLLIFLWWLWLIYLGFKSCEISSASRLKKALIAGILIFFMFHHLISFVESRIVNSQINKCIDIILKTDIDKQISEGPSSYLKASLDAYTVSENKMMPETVRYRFLIKKIVFIISLPIFDDNKKLVAELISKLKERKFIDIENILYANRRNLFSNLNLDNELSLAKSLRESPDYFDFHVINIFAYKQVYDPVPISPDFIVMSGMNILRFPKIIPGEIIAIFP